MATRFYEFVQDSVRDAYLFGVRTGKYAQNTTRYVSDDRINDPTLALIVIFALATAAAFWARNHNRYLLGVIHLTTVTACSVIVSSDTTQFFKVVAFLTLLSLFPVVLTAYGMWSTSHLVHPVDPWAFGVRSLCLIPTAFILVSFVQGLHSRDGPYAA
jgi:hypothetical protein